MLSYVLTVNNTSPNGPKASITKAVKPTQLSLSLSSGTVGTANVELNALIKNKKKVSNQRGVCERKTKGLSSFHTAQGDVGGWSCLITQTTLFSLCRSCRSDLNTSADSQGTQRPLQMSFQRYVHTFDLQV